MSRLLRSWRTSILVRVSAITLALSTLLIFVVGTLLSTQISSGVYREKMTASISEADSLVNYSQGQLDATTYRSDLKLSAVIDTIFHVDDVNANVIQREVILLPTPTTAKKSTRYQGSSNFLDFSIIDAKFREQVRKHATVQSKYITIK